MEEKTYCVDKGKYGLEISCCEDGLTWEEAVEMLIYFHNIRKTEGV